MSVSVHAQGIKTVHTGRGEGVKKWQNSVHVVTPYQALNCRLCSRTPERYFYKESPVVNK